MQFFTLITKRALPLLAAALLLPACSHYSKAKKLAISAITADSKQEQLYQAAKKLKQSPLKQLGLYIEAANTARLKLASSPSALSDYNFAVARIVEIIQDADLEPWQASLNCITEGNSTWKLSLKPQNSRQKKNLAHYKILPTDRYRFKGKLVGERNIKAGLGAPVIAVANSIYNKKKNQPTPNTSLQFYGLTAVLQFTGSQCELHLIDPLAKEHVSLDKHTYPLAADFQAPLAMALAELNLKKAERSGMFSPTKHEHSARLAPLQPYDPNKTPVLFIHGLGNSPGTWAPMFDYLRNDAQIRQRYQFWFFSYPTGIPYPVSAAALRTQLDQMKKQYPNHKDIIVVAHSLGGNISRLLITDSGMKLWDKYYAKDPSDIPFSPETRKLMSEALIFKARPDISRVIFASASLRGSNDATNFLGRLGSKLIGNPFSEDSITEESLAYVRPEIRQMGRKHLPNSVDILNPENQLLQAINALPIKAGIPYHTLIGDRGKGGNRNHTEPISTDGIVPYWSSHMDGAQSETVIPSEHWSILHQQGMAEVKRILLKY